jgi:oligopeptide/dipeptide ABC transporter ATP-binding protein
VEQGSVDDIFADHHHPYTHGLLRSVPRLDRPAEDLVEIKGIVPVSTICPRAVLFPSAVIM